MWSHYADEHRGFCIGFDRLKLEGHLKDVTSVDVRYQSTYPISEISKKLEAGAAENIDLEFLKYKYSYWRYEREWRLIGRNLGGKGVEIDGKMIRSVAFGLRMKEEDKSRLREILSSSEFSHVQIYQSECNDDKFGLKFTRLN
ncbi:hypothetical protein LF95_20190 [Thalassospira sp. TSL5-1]|nr:hypothetical protein LF95_20190 [Thalassospira sp. TSL5-1]